MTTVRLDIKSRGRAKASDGAPGQTKSEVIRGAIDHLVEEEEKRPSAYDRLQPFIGIIERGDSKFSKNTGKRFREILENRQSARRSG